MARYIDADKLIEKIVEAQEELKTDSDALWEIRKKTYKALCRLRRMIDDMPTADVIPKSEVEKLRYKYELAVAEREANVKGFTEELSKAKTEVAESLGYRKQSEGEWIKHPCSYECTVCKEEFFVEGYAEDYDPITDWDLHFCPHCGAKMKGGAE